MMDKCFFESALSLKYVFSAQFLVVDGGRIGSIDSPLLASLNARI